MALLSLRRAIKSMIRKKIIRVKKISCKCQGVAFIASGSKKISSGLKLLNKYCCFFLLIKFKNITNNWLKKIAAYLRPTTIKK
ncbi:hypothetical protein QWY26_18840 [Acinetobacter baumannii]|uniref:hypothetical protein n=1 Tax=Acinetobacter baumannii TaxID=470 RepID=UPI00261329FE|nr:hypothetical protein [Acinetobacter baumannii]WKA73618.1 hypothetical protein QWY26_18840 [Acinetobacter baumannii]